MSHTHDEIQDLLGAYALHAVEPDEVALVEGHLEECPRCRAEVAGHREVATMLGNTGGDAPEGLWERISSELEESPPPMRLDLPAPGGTVIPLASRRRRQANRVVVAAIGIAAVLAIGVLGAQVVGQQARLDDFEAAVEEGSMLSMANVALRDPHALKAKLEAFGQSGVKGTAVLLPNGTGFLVAHELPPLADGGTYQLWGRTGDGPLISLGLLGGEPGTVAFQAGRDVDAIAVTAEQAGGVTTSRNLAVLAGEFD